MVGPLKERSTKEKITGDKLTELVLLHYEELKVKDNAE